MASDPLEEEELPCHKTLWSKGLKSWRRSDSNRPPFDCEPLGRRLYNDIQRYLLLLYRYIAINCN